MWKKGELVWANLRYPHTWLPGRVLDPSEPFGVLVSFFDLMEPRYFPASFLRRFDCHFGALVSDSRRLRRFLKQALEAHFWNISYGLWCSCQSAIVSPYFDRESSFPWFPLSSDLALGLVRNLAVSLSVPLEGLADACCSNAQILSFRCYIVDFECSKAVYQETKARVNLMDQHEVQDLVDDEVQILRTRNSRDPLASVFLKACNTMALSGKREECYPSKSGNRDFVKLGNCTINTEAAVEEAMYEDANTLHVHKHPYSNSTGLLTSVLEPAPDHMIEAFENIINSNNGNLTSLQQSSHLLDVRNGEAGLIELTRSVNETDTYLGERSATRKLCCSLANAEAIFEGTTDGSTVIGTLKNPVDAPDSLSAETAQVPFCMIETLDDHVSFNGGGVAPTEKFSHLLMTANDGTQMSDGDNAKSIDVKRKASMDIASRNSSKKKRVAQPCASVNKLLILRHQLAQRGNARYISDSRCLSMKFLGSHDLPNKGDLLRKFSAFGKIDTSRTDVYPCNSSARIVFIRSIDAVAAYEYAKSKNVAFGQTKVLYQLNPLEQEIEGNKAPTSWQLPTPTLKSCFKKQTLVDKRMKRRNLKVRFQIETNG